MLTLVYARETYHLYTEFKLQHFQKHTHTHKPATHSFRWFNEIRLDHRNDKMLRSFFDYVPTRMAGKKNKNGFYNV